MAWVRTPPYFWQCQDFDAAYSFTGGDGSELCVAIFAHWLMIDFNELKKVINLI